MISRIIQMLLWNLLDNFMEFLKLFLNLTDTFMWKVERQFIWIWSWKSELNDSLDPLILRNFGWFNSTCVRFLTGNFKTAIIYSGHVLLVIWNDPAHSNDKQNQSSNIAYNCWYLKSQEGLSRLAFLFRTVEKLFIHVFLFWFSFTLQRQTTSHEYTWPARLWRHLP